MNEFYRTELNPKVEDYDLAIIPIDEYGSLGNLNAKLLLAYGYDQSILKDLDLDKGYDLFELNARPLLFVVTISNRRKTPELLRENLYEALYNTASQIGSKRIWIPLLGTGVGGLTYEQSWQILVSVLNELYAIGISIKANITIAIPDDDKGRELYQTIQGNNAITGNIDLADLLKNEKLHFFLVGSSWDGDEQADRFYDEGIWETGYDDKYSDIINSVRAGDILIHKSAYPTRQGDSILRIKGWGRVDENPHNGTSLFVEWAEKGLRENIKDMGYYRNTIVEPNRADLIVILNSLSPKVYSHLLNTIRSADIKKGQMQFAGLVSDSDSGADYLNIMPDVNSFALLLAAKTFDPPLAVALLGRWGSGKSFFMQKLRDQIVRLSDRDSIYFCKGIANVHFNAWSYMDANLWASITTRIFEGLSQYIKNDSLAKKKEEEVEELLTKDLSVTQDELKGLKKEKLEIESQLLKLSEKKGKAKEQLDKNIALLKKKTLMEALSAVDKQFDVKERLVAAVAENPGIKPGIEQLEKIVPEEYWETPEKIFEKVQSLPVILRLFVNDKDANFNVKWLIVMVVLLLGIPIGMSYLENHLYIHKLELNPNLWALMAFALSLYVQGRKVYKRIEPFVTKMWLMRGEYLKAIKNTVSRFEQEEKALLQQIEYSKTELESINGQINSITMVKSTIEFKIKNAKSTQALYDFIDKRCNSEEYKKHLGLVSLIRNDFETLSGLLTGHRKELSDTKDAAKFRKLFERPLERIILYIDDLDRCPEERVVEVLEAVNLLMAFPLFIVVVGVDPAWVKSALITKHKKQFAFKDPDFKTIEPSDYLEKIFQISFHLKQAEDSSIKNMLRSLSQVQALPTTRNEAIDHDSDIRGADYETIVESENGYENVDGNISRNIAISHENVVRALTFTEKELSFIEDMSTILGDNPRLVKRYMNIYRIIKSHEDISKENMNESQLQIILFLLALTLSKYRPLVPSLSIYLGQVKNNSGFLRYLTEKSLKDEDQNINTMKDDLQRYLSTTWPEMLSLESHNLEKHLTFIRRFTL